MKDRLEALAAEFDRRAKRYDNPKNDRGALGEGLHCAYAIACTMTRDILADLPAPEPMSAEVERLTRELCELVYDSQPLAGDVEGIGMPLTRRLLALLDKAPAAEAIDIPPPTEPVQFSRPLTPKPDPRRYVTHAFLDSLCELECEVTEHEFCAEVIRVDRLEERLTALESGRFGVRAALRDWWGR